MRNALLIALSLLMLLPGGVLAESSLVRFEGGIGATPAAIANGVLVINTPRGVPPAAGPG